MACTVNVDGVKSNLCTVSWMSEVGSSYGSSFELEIIPWPLSITKRALSLCTLIDT